MSRFKIGIIGAAATSCILGIYLKNRGHKVLIFEKGNKIGGAWQVDNLGSVFSNIIAPSVSPGPEVKNLNKIVNFLKKYKIKFNKNYQKALFTKKIIRVKASDFRGLINVSKRKLQIRHNYEIKNIKENKNFIMINNKLKLDYIFHPKHVYVKKINLLKGKKKNLKITNKVKQVIKSKHIRFFCKDLNVNKIAYNEAGIGPLDRLQIFNDRFNKKIVNGRIKLEWKKRTKNQILNGIKKSFNIKKINSPKFSTYTTQKLSDKNYINLVKNIKKSKRVKFINTSSITEFVYENFIKKRGFAL